MEARRRERGMAQREHDVALQSVQREAAKARWQGDLSLSDTCFCCCASCVACRFKIYFQNMPIIYNQLGSALCGANESCKAAR
eukprot:7563846-Lingulodinium_polyedra.AAC.1